jgi:hypothetical protein
MAEAMQGIMALQGASDMGGQAAPELNVTPEQMAAFESARDQINPAEFGTELLKAGEQIDPMELKSLRDMLKQANLSPQIIDAIGQMVDTVLAEPEKYLEIRARFLAEGVPEDLLPAQFDAEFFAALNLALDQVNTSFPQDNPMQGGIASVPMGAEMPMATPETFARGGLASLKPIAAGLAKMGRRGDTMLAHITPSEARLLRRRGGSGTTNPATGLPEFFLGGVFKTVGNAFKAVGKAVVSGVKAVAKGVKKFASSTVGRVVIAVALAYFLGPAAASFIGVTSTVGVAAVGGFIGGFGSTLAAGKGFKEALKVGAIGGVGAGIGAGVIGGASAFSAGSYAGPTTISGQFDSLVSGVKGLAGTTPPAPGAEAFPVPAPSSLSGTPDSSLLPVPSPPPVEVSSLSPPTPSTVDLANLDIGPVGPYRGVGGDPGTLQYGSTPPAPVTPVAAPATTPSDTYQVETGGALATDPTGGYPTTPSTTPSAGAPQGGTGKGFFGNLVDKISPSPMTPEQIQKAGMDAYTNTVGTEGVKLRAYDTAVAAAKAASPSLLRQYGPLALGAIGLTSLSGGMKSQPAEQPNLTGGVTGEQLLEQDPAKYRPFFGGVRRVASTPTSYYTPSTYTNDVRPVEPVRNFAQGGITSLDGYPKKQGAINGAGTGTSDSIKALLSDGEFVFTAKAVRGAGQGSRRKGAKRMYQLMRSLEGKA